MSETVTVKAPAKINWALKITGVQDGFHELDMIMDTVSLYDTLTFDRTEDGTITVQKIAQVRNPEDNLIWRAAKALQDKTATGFGVKVGIDKKIPSGAGLGGGSADAAATLRALNALWELDLSKEELERIALTIGSDVPFCVRGGRMRAKGRGQILSPCGGTGVYHLLIAKGELGSPTGPVYQGYDRWGTEAHVETDALADALKKQEMAELAPLLGGNNDLSLAAKKICPEITRTLTLLEKTEPVAFWMTGSGAACVALYPDEESAVEAYEKVRHHIYWSCAVQTIGRKDAAE